MSKRFAHNLSHRRAQTMPPGKIVPAGLVEVLPGDTFQINMSAVVRAMPMAAPIFTKVHVRLRAYFVPNRLVWPDFTEKFVTGGDDGEQAPEMPSMVFGSGGRPAVAVGDLMQYYGLPVGPASGALTIHSGTLVARGYGRIYNDLIRDTQLQTPRVVSTAAGLDTTTDVSLQASNWGRDYFTSCKKEPQLGPEVIMPLGDTAPVLGTFDGPDTPYNAQLSWPTTSGVVTGDDVEAFAAGGQILNIRNVGSQENLDPTAGIGVDGLSFDLTDQEVLADLSAATGLSPLELRKYNGLQRFLENNNFSGSRYYEWLRRLGVRYSDARLQIPEYLGGNQIVMQHSEVLSTSAITDEPGPGQLYGHGLGAMRSNRFRWTAQEHGYIHILAEIIPETMYAQGVPKTMLRETNVDYFVPELAAIGADPVYNKELYVDHSQPDGIFGYQIRDDSYRFSFNTVHADFLDTLDYWTAARLFESDVALNGAFLAANPTTRYFQVPADPRPYLMFLNHSIRARRLVPRRQHAGRLM